MQGSSEVQAAAPLLPTKNKNILRIKIKFCALGKRVKCIQRDLWDLQLRGIGAITFWPLNYHDQGGNHTKDSVNLEPINKSHTVGLMHIINQIIECVTPARLCGLQTLWAADFSFHFSVLSFSTCVLFRRVSESSAKTFHCFLSVSLSSFHFFLLQVWVIQVIKK